MSRYLVQFPDPTTRRTGYGIVDEYHADAVAFQQQGLTLVADAVLPVMHQVQTATLCDIVLDMGRWDPEHRTFVEQDAYHAHVAAEHAKARELSDALPAGVQVGAVFSVGGGDGSAWYVVTRVFRKTCRIEWRGFCPDRYVDHMFGYGGSFRLADVERYVRIASVTRPLLAPCH